MSQCVAVCGSVLQCVAVAVCCLFCCAQSWHSDHFRAPLRLGTFVCVCVCLGVWMTLAGGRDVGTVVGTVVRSVGISFDGNMYRYMYEYMVILIYIYLYIYVDIDA